MEALNWLMRKIEQREAETARLRNIYYHLQRWINIGVIQDEETCSAVRRSCIINYPILDWDECYKRAMEDTRK